MLSYIREINSKCPKDNKYINLYYNQDVKLEIDAYFSAAEKLVESNEAPDPSKKPMMYILDGAKTKSDIVQRKTLFYGELERKGIKLFEYD